MPNYHNNQRFGNLFATVSLTTPKNLSEEEVKLVPTAESTARNCIGLSGLGHRAAAELFPRYFSLL